MKTALALLLVSASAFGQDAAKIGWKKDHDAALKEAGRDGRYVVVHFSGPN
jgi:hypothetical protein